MIVSANCSPSPVRQRDQSHLHSHVPQRRSLLKQWGAVACVFVAWGVHADAALAQSESTATNAKPRSSPRGGSKATHGPILVIGDSLSAEYGLKRGEGWVALLAKRLQAEGIQREVINASISGETTSGGRSRLQALLDQHQPSLVVIELGGNDAMRGLPLTMTRDNLTSMARSVRGMGAQVLLLGMQVPPNYGRAYGEEFSQSFARVAKAEGAELVPFMLKGVADIADADRYFQSDRIHPNALAHPKMLDNVWPSLERMLVGPKR